MKPASIIFLIVSVILVIIGFITTSVAMNLAPEGEKPVVEISDKDVGCIDDPIYIDDVVKIELKLKAANVNIIGGAQKPYVELVNFPKGLYSASHSKNTLTVTDLSDFTSISGVASLASNFHGLRGFVNYFKLANFEKTVNIYLSADYPVNVISCNLKSGEVRIESCVGSSDYNITLGAGDVSINNVDTTSLLSINIGTGNTVVQNGDIVNFKAVVETGSVTLDANIEQANIKITAGNLICAYPCALDTVNLRLFTNVGKITADGVSQGGYKEIVADSSKSMTVNIGTGDIDITSGTAPIE